MVLANLRFVAIEYGMDDFQFLIEEKVRPLRSGGGIPLIVNQVEPGMENSVPVSAGTFGWSLRCWPGSSNFLSFS